MRSKGSDADNREKGIWGMKREQKPIHEKDAYVYLSLASSSCECIFTRTQIRVSRVSDSFLRNLHHAILGGAGASIDKIYDLRRKRGERKREKVKEEGRMKQE